MLRETRCRYIGATLVGSTMTTTGSAASVDLGQDYSSISRASAGTWSGTLKKPFNRTPILVGTPSADIADGGYFKSRAASITTSLIQGRTVNGSNVADEGTSEALVCGWFSQQSGPGKIQRVNASVRKTRWFGGKITGTTGAVAIGKRDVTCTRSAQGVYVITFTKAFATTPVVVATTIGTDAYDPKIVSKTAKSVNISMFDTSGVAQDADFYFIAYGTDCRDPHGGAREILDNSQRVPLLIAGRITYTTGTPAVTINSTDIASVTDTGTGDVALTFATFPEGYIFKREPIVIASNDSYKTHVKAAATATGVSLYCMDESGSAQDPTTIDYIILGSGDATEF